VFLGKGRYKNTKRHLTQKIPKKPEKREAKTKKNWPLAKAKLSGVPAQ
jgi:hypothetical protein